MPNYAGVDLPSAEYTPLSSEWLAVEATLGKGTPKSVVVAVPVIWSGVLNAVVWTWEADLDDEEEVPLSVRCQTLAERTHMPPARHPQVDATIRNLFAS